MTAMSIKDTAVNTGFLKLIASRETGSGKRPITSNNKAMMPRIRGQ
jgi:hypothetical protein